MFRLMGSIYKDTHILKSTVICDDTKDSRTQKVFHSLDSICHKFDLPSPMWLDANVKDFQSFPKYVFLRITLLKFWILIILKFRLLKKIKNGIVCFKFLSNNPVFSIIIFLIILFFFLHIPVFPRAQTYSFYSFLHPVGQMDLLLSSNR